MKPHLTISAMPATRSGRGSVDRASRSQSTPAGGWNEPTRFLPSGVLIPVFPPTAASTIASSVVGTWTTRTPRSQVAATNPARSVTVPPPTPTTASVRVNPACPSAPQSSAATTALLASSASGTTARYGVEPGGSRGVGDLLRPDRERRRVDDEDPLNRLAEQRHDGVDDPVADDDLVRVVAGPDGDARERAGHAPAPGSGTTRRPATSAATCSGVRPAVSARTVATAS